MLIGEISAARRGEMRSPRRAKQAFACPPHHPRLSIPCCFMSRRGTMPASHLGARPRLAAYGQHSNEPFPQVQQQNAEGPDWTRSRVAFGQPVPLTQHRPISKEWI